MFVSGYFLRQSDKNASVGDETDPVHEKLIDLEPLLKISREKIFWSINSAHSDYPCHCAAQTFWYPERSKLGLIWEVEEVKSLVLLDHEQPFIVFLVSSMMALRSVEESSLSYREGIATTIENIYTIDFSRSLELFETLVTTEVKRIWSQLLFFPLVWATLTSWLYKRAKTQMKMHVKEYIQFLMEVEQEVFKRFYPRNGVKHAWERVGECLKLKEKRAKQSQKIPCSKFENGLHGSLCEKLGRHYDQFRRQLQVGEQEHGRRIHRSLLRTLKEFERS